MLALESSVAAVGSGTSWVYGCCVMHVGTGNLWYRTGVMTGVGQVEAECQSLLNVLDLSNHIISKSAEAVTVICHAPPVLHEAIVNKHPVMKPIPEHAKRITLRVVHGDGLTAPEVLAAENARAALVEMRSGRIAQRTWGERIGKA
jgi:hypothetical protein